MDGSGTGNGTGTGNGNGTESGTIDSTGDSKSVHVTTYGLIVYYEDFSGKKDLTFHVSQRRDTIAYIHFIRGGVQNDKLVYCFARMTRDEKYRILNHSFDELWFDLHSDRALKITTQFETARQRFAELWAKGPNGEEPLLPKLLLTSTDHISLDWGFPKGRKKHPQEPDLVCALREYREETHNKCYLEFLDHPPFICETATHRIVYYVARSKFKPKPKYYTLEFGSLRRESISEETADLKWVTLFEAKRLLSVALLQVLEEVVDYLKGINSDATFLLLQDAITIYGGPTGGGQSASGPTAGPGNADNNVPVDLPVEKSQ